MTIKGVGSVAEILQSVYR